MHKTESRPGQRGFSLLEVLVAAAVFSVGLGGLSLMMLTSVRGSVEAQNQTIAAMHAASLAELILLNPAATGHYINPTSGVSNGCLAPETCSASAWAASNLARWQYELEQYLTEAKGVVCLDGTPDDGSLSEPECDGSGNTVVKVFWAEPHHHGDPDHGLRRLALPVAE